MSICNLKTEKWININRICGDITVPPSKSFTHRAIICSALGVGKSVIHNVDFSDDILASIQSIKNIGATVNIKSGCVEIIGNGVNIVNSKFNFNESGSSIRFMIPIAMTDYNYDGFLEFDGSGSLVRRSLKVYTDIFKSKNIEYIYDGKLPLKVRGKMYADSYYVRGDISSQFITGLMLALSVVNKKSEINIVDRLESKSYIDITLDVMKKFGVSICNYDYKKFVINNKVGFKSTEYRIEGDYSQAAFFIVAAILNGDIRIHGLNKNSVQGDRAIVDIVKKMGADIYFEGDILFVKKSKTFGTDIDMSDIPDMLPALSVLAAFSEGSTRFYNGERIRLKESDRIKAMYTELTKLGAKVVECRDGLIIEGVNSLGGGLVDSHNDHRIAMALAVCSIGIEQPIKILGANCVKKSYPNFFDDLEKLDTRG